LPVTLLLVGTLAPGPAFAQEGAGAPGEAHAAAMFEKSCYSCHNIGGGDKKGPDLMGLLERRDQKWARDFTRSATSMRDAGDPIALKLFQQYAPEEMGDQMLSEDQIDEILELVEAHTKSKKPFVPTSGRLKRQPVPRDIPAGKRLFTGETPFASGAPSCISCHSVAGVGALGGGRLGPDLTGANLKYTDIELASVLKTSAFPTMVGIYGKKPPTDDEVVKLFAYLQSVKNKTPDPAPASTRFLALSVGGVLAVWGAMSFAWRGRLRPRRVETDA
jgi:mono/diheme cytochrome c family protein